MDRVDMHWSIRLHFELQAEDRARDRPRHHELQLDRCHGEGVQVQGLGAEVGLQLGEVEGGALDLLVVAGANASGLLGVVPLGAEQHGRQHPALDEARQVPHPKLRPLCQRQDLLRQVDQKPAAELLLEGCARERVGQLVQLLGRGCQVPHEVWLDGRARLRR
eukprot:10006260-Heterocapsa_arctica.AAC.1